MEKNREEIRELYTPPYFNGAPIYDTGYGRPPETDVRPENEVVINHLTQLDESITGRLNGDAPNSVTDIKTIQLISFLIFQLKM